MDSWQSVDIVIPCYNSEATLGACLESVFGLDYPRDKYKVIIVDNGSTDKTPDIAARFGCSYLRHPDGNVGAVRNRGAVTSDADILAFTDSDCIVPRSWLKDAITRFSDESVGAVGGGCLVPPDATWLEKVWVSQQLEELRDTTSLPASNFLVRRDIFSRLGGFNEAVVAGEDDELSSRLNRGGYRMLSVRSCYVIHLGYPKTLIGILKRQIWHASNSIEIKAGYCDKMFIASCIFTLASLLLLISPLLSFQVTQVAALIMSTIVSLAALNKIFRSQDNGFSFNIVVKCIQLVCIYFFFFVGRSIGLLVNCKKQL